MAKNVGFLELHCRVPDQIRPAFVPKRPARFLLRVQSSIDQVPLGYDFKAATLAPARKALACCSPRVKELVEEGLLVAVARRQGYVERRLDGYQEPKMVYLLGTTHRSQQSADDVQQVVQELQPQSVVVELCRSRAGVMYDDPASPEVSTTGRVEPLVLPQWAVPLIQGNRSMQLGGAGGLLLTTLMARMDGQASMPGGGSRNSNEFRAARIAAEGVSAQIVLGDRPLEITAQRAWEAVSWGQRLQLLWLVLRAPKQLPTQLPPPEQALQQLQQLSQGITPAGMGLPPEGFGTTTEALAKVVRVLLDERDQYLAWCLQRSKAVNQAERVVGVVGLAHLRGIAYHLQNSDGNLRFKDLVGRRDWKRRQATRGRKG
ncbi:hypothetical protein WJX74_002859 [Apatococcus lobatus]|uniref:Uncharacterized protein n=2 Tax=Apatococcus TaxID=904362 RepID=A0AAW1SVC1_9CHLO